MVKSCNCDSPLVVLLDASLQAVCERPHCFGEVVVEVDINDLVVLSDLPLIVKANILQQNAHV